ncbi:hypothetical protein CVT24_002654, partial [Panaeolus cyanescens]
FGRSGRGSVGVGEEDGFGVDEFGVRLNGEVDDGRVGSGREVDGSGREVNASGLGSGNGREVDDGRDVNLNGKEEYDDEFGDASNLKEFGPTCPSSSSSVKTSSSSVKNPTSPSSTSSSIKNPTSPSLSISSSNSRQSQSQSQSRHRPAHTIDRISQMFSVEVREEGERESGALWRASMVGYRAGGEDDGIGEGLSSEGRNEGRMRESLSTMTQFSGMSGVDDELNASTATVRREGLSVGVNGMHMGSSLGLGLEESPQLSNSPYTASSSPSFHTAHSGASEVDFVEGLNQQVQGDGASKESSPDPNTNTNTDLNPNSLSPKSLHLSLRAERTRSKGLKEVLKVRQRSRSRGAGDAPRSGPPDVPLPELPKGLRNEREKERESEKLKERERESARDKEMEKERETEKDDILDGLEEMGRRVSGMGVRGSLREKRVGERRRSGVSGEGGEMTMDELGIGRPPLGSMRGGDVNDLEEDVGGDDGVPFPSTQKTPLPSRHQKRQLQRQTLGVRDGSVSPDIEDLLSSTPRPGVRSKSRGRYESGSGLSRSSTTSSSGANEFGMGEGGRGRLRSFASVSALSERSGGGGGFGSGNGSGGVGRRVSEGLSKSAGARGRESWVDHGFGIAGDDNISGGGGGGEGSGERQRGRRGRVSNDASEEGGDSDSSLDLHTPLPHLMLRHGLLSPHSKLLPQSASRSNTPALGGDGRPGSGMSWMSNAGSVMTKSGIIKDERDTPMRRVRHRDGKLLRGGIGLTTGLGWSDSEDEDAPSPLTRRLSQLNLQRRASSSSIGTSTSYMSHSAHGGYAYATAPVGRKQPHPLTRSYSYGTLADTSEFGVSEFGRRGEFGEGDHEIDHIHGEEDGGDEDRTLQSTGEWAQRHRKPSLPPPTSWNKKSGAGSRPSSGGSVSVGLSSRRSSANSVGGGVGGGGSAGYGYRTSTSSLNSTREVEEVDEYGRLVGGARRSASGRSSVKVAAGGGGVGNNRESVGSAVSASHSYSGSGSGSGSGSSASASVGPLTPHDSVSLTTTTMTRGKMDKEKSLPPLPSSLKKPRVTSASSVGSTGTTGGGIPRSRTVSTASSTTGGLRKPSSTVSTTTTTTTAADVTTTQATSTASPRVRPLQLPKQAQRLGGGADRAPVPVPSISTSSTVLNNASIPRSPSSSLVSPLSASTGVSSSIRTPLSATNPHGYSALSVSSSRSFGRLSSASIGSSSVSSSPNLVTSSSNNAISTSAIRPPGLKSPVSGVGVGAKPPLSPNPMSPGVGKPRTGTGMVYKSSGSKMRAPMVLSSSASVGNLKGGR